MSSIHIKSRDWLIWENTMNHTLFLKKLLLIVSSVTIKNTMLISLLNMKI